MPYRFWGLLDSCLAAKVCAPVHDAILIEAPLDELDQVIEQTKDIMAEASSIVLSGFRLNSDAKAIRYPDRYMDEQGIKIWNTVTTILDGLETPTCAAKHGYPCASATQPVHLRPPVPSYYFMGES